MVKVLKKHRSAKARRFKSPENIFYIFPILESVVLKQLLLNYKLETVAFKTIASNFVLIMFKNLLNNTKKVVV